MKYLALIGALLICLILAPLAVAQQDAHVPKLGDIMIAPNSDISSCGLQASSGIGSLRLMKQCRSKGALGMQHSFM